MDKEAGVALVPKLLLFDITDATVITQSKMEDYDLGFRKSPDTGAPRGSAAPRSSNRDRDDYRSSDPYRDRRRSPGTLCTSQIR